MIFLKKMVGILVVAAVGGLPAMSVMAADAAGNAAAPAKRAPFIENPNPKGVCLKILIAGIRCPIPNPVH